MKELMEKLVTEEEKRLGVGSEEFMKRHEEIMNECEEISQSIKKSEKIEIRVSSAQKQMIKDNAAKLGLTVSAYLVMLAMKDNN